MTELLCMGGMAHFNYLGTGMFSDNGYKGLAGGKVIAATMVVTTVVVWGFAYIAINNCSLSRTHRHMW